MADTTVARRLQRTRRALWGSARLQLTISFRSLDDLALAGLLPVYLAVFVLVLGPAEEGG